MVTQSFDALPCPEVVGGGKAAGVESASKMSFLFLELIQLEFKALDMLEMCWNHLKSNTMLVWVVCESLQAMASLFWQRLQTPETRRWTTLQSCPQCDVLKSTKLRRVLFDYGKRSEVVPNNMTSTLLRALCKSCHLPWQWKAFVVSSSHLDIDAHSVSLTSAPRRKLKKGDFVWKRIHSFSCSHAFNDHVMTLTTRGKLSIAEQKETHSISIYALLQHPTQAPCRSHPKPCAVLLLVERLTPNIGSIHTYPSH